LAALNRIMLSLELFCYWYFLSAGFGSIGGKITFFIGSFLSAWSIYNGIKWHYSAKDGEGLSWAVIGILTFAGLSVRWLITVA